jgi:hypothetical protein
MIEAGGGSANVVTVDIAARQGAFVKIRPIRQNALFAAIMPEYVL